MGSNPLSYFRENYTSYNETNMGGVDMRKFMEFLKLSSIVYLGLLLIQYVIVAAVLLGGTVFGGFKEIINKTNTD